MCSSLSSLLLVRGHHGQIGHDAVCAHGPLARTLSLLACAPAGCEECLSSRHSVKDSVLLSAGGIYGLESSGYSLPAQQVTLWSEL